MAIQTVKVGAAVNDGTGDPSRTCFTKINSNFTDNANAASRLVGTTPGNVMEVGAFGLGSNHSASFAGKATDYKQNTFFGGGALAARGFPCEYALGYQLNGAGVWQAYLIHDVASSNVWVSQRSNSNAALQFHRLITTANSSVDSNGFIKAASPIVKIFADKIELNDEAAQQDITFEKLGVGDYLIKGSTGFAQEGWYIETPKDANGNVLVSVIYKQLDNNDISVKTYAKMFDEETGDIVANTAKPRDIPTARWIDLRLQALPQDDTQPLSKDETVATNAE